MSGFDFGYIAFLDELHESMANMRKIYESKFGSMSFVEQYPDNQRD